jgi:hypothetical protein
VRDIQKEILSHPFAPLLQAFGMTGGTKPPGAAGEHQEVLPMAVRTADAGEPAARVAAVEVALDHLLDNGPEEPVLLLEGIFILDQEPFEVMK